ncbi:nuclear transport factor 2 family protein [Epibacterium sp. Ofav1-8]|uniref:nuclear transport factor 2 family protein n=1 Tax=Epibacterium sp. Ofav1-8 TaxID=2917735 RepID=UPI001EF675BE|nr:nuclear transport factor 2 family protein [Epibacterium sp. Ofav1-8]MCG7625031.1 nuclear transport factor 2 family protein [Epibacterium sp. Ofav1-8]
MRKFNHCLRLATCTLALTLNPLVARANEAVENAAIVGNAFETWSEGTYIFDQILAPDVVWTVHGSGPAAGRYTSMADFVEKASTPLVSRLATPLIPKVHEFWAVRDTVIVRFDGAATTTSGSAYNNQFVWILKMQEGRVVEAEVFLDLRAYDEVVENNAPKLD